MFFLLMWRFIFIVMDQGQGVLMVMDNCSSLQSANYLPERIKDERNFNYPILINNQNRNSNDLLDLKTS